MLVRETDKIFRCDDACCKNFATYEIVVGGATGKLSLCDDHYLDLLKQSKMLIKNQTKKMQ